jgi:hypothetical protein
MSGNVALAVAIVGVVGTLIEVLGVLTLVSHSAFVFSALTTAPTALLRECHRIHVLNPC